MPQMTAVEANKARADLKSAGCPDDCCDALANSASPGIIAQIIALVTQYGPQVWAIIQVLLPLLNPPAPTPNQGP